ncbi:proline--tRNA ligase, partial [candidate division KSB1 bacterium]
NIQSSLLQRAIDFRNENTHFISNYEEFKNIFKQDGGFVYAHWCGNTECELKIKDETKATIRAIPLDSRKEKGSCILCKSASNERVIFAKSY